MKKQILRQIAIMLLATAIFLVLLGLTLNTNFYAIENGFEGYAFPDQVKPRVYFQFFGFVLNIVTYAIFMIYQIFKIVKICKPDLGLPRLPRFRIKFKIEKVDKTTKEDDN